MTPVAPAVLAGEQAATESATKQQPPPSTPSRQMSRQPRAVPHLDVTAVDLAGQPAPRYFTATQFSTLRKLGDLLVPPLKNNPGASEAQAPEFLDFIISASPEDRQKLYLSGLDSLQEQAIDKFQKSFSDLDAGQADAILRPLFIARPWPQDLPNDPLQNFIAQVHDDLRTATMNSREWAAASEKSGHLFTRGSRTTGFYWSPIDPISEG
ncbi:MAG TPA: gluconate 2-dehydrogenase subunit 3 family protein [Bryobacteraceae bacterium]|nr:gluconate 2-dehydrogenase subunit 3 family protein [Bryobacteraceae bacterium]